MLHLIQSTTVRPESKAKIGTYTPRCVRGAHIASSGPTKAGAPNPRAKGAWTHGHRNTCCSHLSRWHTAALYAGTCTEQNSMTKIRPVVGQHPRSVRSVWRYCVRISALLLVARMAPYNTHTGSRKQARRLLMPRPPCTLHTAHCTLHTPPPGPRRAPRPSVSSPRTPCRQVPLVWAACAPHDAIRAVGLRLLLARLEWHLVAPQICSVNQPCVLPSSSPASR